MGRLRVVCFHIRSFEVGSPPFVSIEDRSSAPVNKIELCTNAYEIYGDPANLVASTVAELNDTPLYFMDDIRIVFGPPTNYPARFSRGR
jgi:hypothetical protein